MIPKTDIIANPFDDIFTIAHRYLQGIQRHEHDAEYHADCPYCRKPAKPGQTHFTYNQHKLVYHCFVCGAQGSLYRFVKDRRLIDPRQLASLAINRRQTAATPSSADTPPYWFLTPDKQEFLLGYYRYHQDAEAIQAWQSYRSKLTPETILKWGLSYARPPGKKPDSMQKEKALILPIMEDGTLVGVRWREQKFMGYCKKRLFNSDAIKADSIVVIVPNQIDAILLMQLVPSVAGHELVAISPTTGEASWSDTWTASITDRKPALIVVAYDHDQTGQKHAVRITEKLTGAGTNAVTWRWPADLPPKFDMGDMLEQYHPDATETAGQLLATFIQWLGNLVRASESCGPIADNARWFPNGLPAPVLQNLLTLNTPPSEMFKSLFPDEHPPALEKWVDDPAPGLIVWHVCHEAIRSGHIAPDGAITQGMVKTAGELLGYELTRHTIQRGFNWLVAYAVFEVIDDLSKFAYYIENEEYTMQKSAGVLTPAPNATLYRPRLLAEVFSKTESSLYAKILYEVPTSFKDYLPDGVVNALLPYVTVDTVPMSSFEIVTQDGTAYTIEESFTDRLLFGLDVLTNLEALSSSPVFVMPTDLPLSNAKALRVAFLRWYFDRHKDARGYLPMSISEKALLLGISARSVSEYSASAGLATEQQTKTATISEVVPAKRVAAFKKIVGKRSAGVYVQIGAGQTYLTPHNRAALEARIEHTSETVTLKIQQKSKLLEADQATIEALAEKRRARHHARLARARNNPEKVNTPRSPKPAPRLDQGENLPEITTARPDGYSHQYLKTMTILLVYLNPQLLSIASEEPVVEGWLRSFGIIGEKSPAGDGYHPHRHVDEDYSVGGLPRKY